MIPIRKTLLALLVIGLLATFAATVLANEFKGRIASVHPEKRELIVTEAVKNWTFQITPQSQISINGRSATIAELRAGDEVVVMYAREGKDKMTAMSVQCMRK